MDRRTVIKGAMAGVAVALLPVLPKEDTPGWVVEGDYGAVFRLPIYYTDSTIHEVTVRDGSDTTCHYYADLDIFSPEIPMAEENNKLWKIRAVYGIQDDIHIIERLSKTKNHVLVGTKAHSFRPLAGYGGYRIKGLDLSLFNNFIPSLYLDVV